MGMHYGVHWLHDRPRGTVHSGGAVRHRKNKACVVFTKWSPLLFAIPASFCRLACKNSVLASATSWTDRLLSRVVVFRRSLMEKMHRRGQDLAKFSSTDPLALYHSCKTPVP